MHFGMACAEEGQRPSDKPAQGVALGWLVFAPLVLPPFRRAKCMTRFNRV